MQSLKAIAVGLLGGASAAADGQTCKVLAMSGGGAKGSYEAGVLWGFLNTDTDTSKYEWDIVTGVSAGSLNTAMVTGFETGDEMNLVKYMSNMWASTGSKDAYKQWSFGGVIRGLTDKQAFLDETPALELVQKIVKELGTCKRNFTVTSVDVNTGAYYEMNDTFSRDIHYRAFVASTRIPAVFEPDHWDGKVLMDGGTVYNTNLVTGVQRCRDAGFADPDIIVDIAICDYAHLD